MNKKKILKKKKIFKISKIYYTQGSNNLNNQRTLTRNYRQKTEATSFKEEKKKVSLAEVSLNNKS